MKLTKFLFEVEGLRLFNGLNIFHEIWLEKVVLIDVLHGFGFDAVRKTQSR